MSVNTVTRDELLALPDRADWQGTSTYDSLLIFGSEEAHESGWSGITVVGVNKGVPVEKVTTYSDDVEWILPAPRMVAGRPYGHMRMDCTHPGKVLHFWAHGGQMFSIGHVLSSITIQVKEKTE